MDMFAQQAPDFIDYPEIYELQKGKLWKELTLDEMCRILEAYGEFIGGEIYETGCRVEHFNLGNEANFGFAGLSVGLENAVEPKLLKMTSVKGYQCSLLNPGWLKKHLWQRQAALLSALSCGLKKHYPDAKYDTHISLISAKSAVMQFQTWIENGYDVYEPGVSFYPSCPGPIKDRMGLLEDTVTQMGDKFDKRVFIAEYAYPSEKDMPEPYQNWTYEIKGYPLSEGSQAMLYHKLVSRGQEIGVSGIRYWGPDFSEWGAMPIFRFDKQNKTADGKKLLDELLEGGR
jgi:arabinogalactan endo-1,4-beta-galactosidase